MTQTTTPDNIPSPDLTDQYALTQDMANLADGTQLALNRRANLYTGTANQRTAFTSAPAGTHWQDTDSLRMEWRKEPTGWVPSVTRWVGSVSQMNSFSQAPDGFEWFDPSTSQRFLRVGGGWVLSGGVYRGRLNATSSFQTATFTPGTFATTPFLVAQVISGASAAIGVSAMITGVSSSGFQYRHSGSSGTFPIDWIATP